MPPVHDFKDILKTFLCRFDSDDFRSVDDIIAYNEAHRDVELPPGKQNLAHVFSTLPQ